MIPLLEHFATASTEDFPLLKFGDSYEAPQDDSATGSASEGSAKKKGRTVAVTTEDMQKRRNDVKARTTLLLALLDEHQLRFNEYKTTQELWAAILKTFGGNEATKMTKKNQLKQQYGNFKAEGSKTLEQTFNRLQAIISHLEFMDVEIKQDDLNQKFLTSLAQKGSSKNNSGKEEVNTASIPTVSTQVSPASANVAAASITHDNACAYIASQSNGLPEFANDTITDYSRPSPSIESNSSDLQNSNSSVFEHGESSESIMSKPMIKFVNASDRTIDIKTNKVEASRKPSIKYAEMYRNTHRCPKVKGNQRNWNNLETHQLGKNFLMKNKACFKCGHFDHLAYDCGVWVEQGRTWEKNNYTYKSLPTRTIFHKTDRTPAAVNRTHINSARPKTTQDFVIIELIQRVKRLERELKARTPPTKIQKVDVRGRSRSVMAWVPKKV
uniref:Ribonuclease H-like domain-containing protein n=1 Tax=Tanacetum cinerariifolium TaxID=118510 RepID=A0A6L2JI19_TANCI|nr:ribonuclease H-like domain-containing protein [Tanacetum cinerariifolium]